MHADADSRGAEHRIRDLLDSASRVLAKHVSSSPTASAAYDACTFGIQFGLPNSEDVRDPKYGTQLCPNVNAADPAIPLIKGLFQFDQRTH
jgi:hypothetical protein